MSGDGKAETGLVVDIAKAVIEAKGHTVSYTVASWSRAIEDCRSGQYNAIIGATIEDAPDFVYPVEEQCQIRFAFFAKKGSPWKYRGIDSLKTIRLAVIQDYGYEQELLDYIKVYKSHVILAKYGLSDWK